VADIAWSIFASSNFSPEELDCAVAGGMWDRASSTCTYPRPIPPAAPLYPVTSSGGSLGSVDPQQMFDDGFVYVNGAWVKADSPEARQGPGQPKVLDVMAVVSSGSVLGYDVPAAAPVALPSFVGGALGAVRIGGGMRPQSGGTPVRVVMGPGRAVFPVVRMGVDKWGR